MYEQNHKSINNFFLAGINYKKSDVQTRGGFAINNDQYAAVLKYAAACGLNELFILSTCNRTEIYGFAGDAGKLMEVLCSQTTGDLKTFTEIAYIKKGEQAIEHLFNVGAGLDSQILGDYEIIGQLKKAMQFSKENGFSGAFTDRLINSVLQASKFIKHNTKLSSGTVSVSFAAIQYIKSKIKNPADKKILLLGAGKIGKNTCKNLVDYLHTKNITLINRTEEKAIEFATSLGIHFSSFENLNEEIQKADIIITATNAPHAIITKAQLANSSEKFIIDLSIPYNVEEDVQSLQNVHLINVDELSKLKDETLKLRETQVLPAKKIIAEAQAEFNEWYEMRKHAPILKAVKTKLKEINTHPLFTSVVNQISDERDAKIQMAVNNMATKIKLKNEGGCQYIEAINHFINSASKN